MQVWKCGTRMRVDGSLMGVDDKARSLIPAWKRGHFSLLFDGAPQPAALLLADHRKRSVVDLTHEKKKHRPEIDDEVLFTFAGVLFSVCQQGSYLRQFLGQVLGLVEGCPSRDCNTGHHTATASQDVAAQSLPCLANFLGWSVPCTQQGAGSEEGMACACGHVRAGGHDHVGQHGAHQDEGLRLHLQPREVLAGRGPDREDRRLAHVCV